MCVKPCDNKKVWVADEALPWCWLEWEEYAALAHSGLAHFAHTAWLTHQYLTTSCVLSRGKQTSLGS